MTRLLTLACAYRLLKCLIRRWIMPMLNKEVPVDLEFKFWCLTRNNNYEDAAVHIVFDLVENCQ